MQFGIGHFAKGELKKGRFCAISEGAITASGISLFVLILNGGKDSSGAFKSPDRAKLYQGVFIGSVSIGFDLAGVS